MVRIKYSVLFIICFLIFTACPSLPPEAENNPNGTSESVKLKERQSSGKAISLEDAVRRSYTVLSKDLPTGSVIAVINISAENPAEGELAAEDLVLFLVTSKNYKIVDRKNLDIIREEQAFQLSGEVDDDTAVAVGHLLGAHIVITGDIITSNSRGKQIRIRAVDVESGQIRAISSQTY